MIALCRKLNRKIPVLALCIASGAAAQEAPMPAPTDLVPDWTIKAHGAVSAGIGVRTSAQKSSLKPGGATNSDDGNLNYAKGDTFSRVVQGLAVVDVQHRGGLGFNLGAMGWYDDNLLHHSVPQGNNPNNYTPGPLSDRGFAPEARFQHVELLDAYAYGKQATAGGALRWQLGWLQLDRLTELSFPGGLRDLETRNSPGGSRPGAFREAATLPVWAATARLDVSPELRLQGFWQLAPRQSVSSGCGTFFSSNDYAQQGCDRVFYSARLTQQQNTAKGLFFTRAPDVLPQHRPDQFGLSASYLLKALATKVSVAYAHYHSRESYTDSVKGVGLGPASGGQYAIEYPGNKNLLALSTSTRFPGANLGWSNELSIIGRQPVQINTSDLLAAGLGAGGTMAATFAAAPNHSLIRGYDRYTVLQLQSGLRKSFDNIGGGVSAFIEGEAGFKHVVGLTDVNERHYGRPETSDACDTPAECATNDGYVTSNAWAYRLRAGLEWRNAAPGVLKLRPSLLFGQDVRGWSYDYAFVQGRKNARLVLDADFVHGLCANLSWVTSWGGQFNARRDRDYLLASIGKQF
jgi:Protein of unknown function (DUF1302)